MKIDWDNIWVEWEIWYEQTGWKKHPFIWTDMRKKIQSLVESQLRKKVRRKK